MTRVVLPLVLLLSSLVHADPQGGTATQLRFATAAPDGTAWARLFRAMGRELEAVDIRTKWYFGGIAGDELQMLERLKHNQLDVVMSGGMLCMKLAPSLRALRLLGLFQTRAEASYVLGLLRPTVDAEFAKAGFRNMGEAGLGSDMIFSRKPIMSFADLKRARIWFWDLDEPMRGQLEAMGVPAVGTPLDQAARAYDERRIDGFLAVPTAALAFQWSAQAGYLSELRLGYLPGCMVMTHASWDSLSMEARRALTEAAAKFAARLEDLGREQDRALLGGLFQRQGLRATKVSAGFASEFFDAARSARTAVRDRMVPGDVVDRISGWLADFRGTYAPGSGER